METYRWHISMIDVSVLPRVEENVLQDRYGPVKIHCQELVI